MRLEQAGVDSPEHDARALAVHVLGLARPSDLALASDIDQGVYDDLVSRRAARVPLQHLVGSVGFRWIELEVGPGVFVPRPETESLVQWAVDHLGAAPLVVDLCAGSGAIAASIAHEVPAAVVHAVEKDPGAVPWTRRNCGDRVEVHEADAADALAHLDGTVDLVISNPPYVPIDDRARMAPEALADPELALFGGADGLDVIRLVERTASRLLHPGGLVVVEHDDSQGVTAPAVFGQGWIEVSDHQDLTGRDRFLTARRAS